MAVIDIHDRLYERREDSPSATPTAIPSSTSPPVVNPLPTSVKALTGLIVVLGLIILGFVAWRIGKWRRSKICAASQMVGADTKPKSFIHVDLVQEKGAAEKAQPEVPYKWQPIARPEPAHSSSKATDSATKRFFGLLTTTARPKPSSGPVEASPPPAYTPHRPPPTPVTIVIGDPEGAHVSHALSQATLDMLQMDPHATHSPAPLPSPVRTKSIGPDTPVFKSFSAAPPPVPPKPAQPKRNTDSIKLLPRIMIVACNFIPSLADELTIKIGEPLMMIEEYEDEWCLVQRVGTAAAERGVVPRFCLQECPDKAISILRKQLMENNQ